MTLNENNVQFTYGHKQNLNCKGNELTVKTNLKTLQLKD